MKKVTWLGLFFTLTLCSLEQTVNAQSLNGLTNKKPNIILVMTDDQGYGDLSLHGNPIVKTPHIDRLGKESVRLDNYHVAPTCSPTRAGLLTGRWNNRTGVWHTIMGRSMLRENEKTLANLLKANDYQTAMFGKWHLGDNYPYRPNDRGFDFAYYHGAGGVGQTPDHWDNAYFDDVYRRNGIKEQATGFVTDVFFNEAIDYINEAKTKNQPFFAFISTNAPHGPMHAPKKYSDIYADKGLTVNTQHFFAMITNIDDNIARLRKYLEANELADNTIFIFTTDNGTSAGDKVFNAGMRGKKNSEYDGGHRVPFFIHWPNGKLAHGSTNSKITSFVDVVPTLLDLVDAKDTLNVEFDGISLKPLLTNTQPNVWPNRVIFTDSQRVLNPIKWRKSAVMTDKWRLINGTALYDMTNDPSQKHDVASAHPRTVSRLRNAYENWWQDISNGFDEPTAIHIGSKNANPVALTSHDWLGDNEKVPWQQRQIRQAIREVDGEHKGYWYLDLKTSGTYRFTLSRWPLSLDMPISSPLPAGKPSTGQTAFRESKGEAFKAIKANISIADISQSQIVGTDDKVVEFDLKLPEGKAKLAATFINQEQQELGAFYVNVEKLTASE